MMPRFQMMLGRTLGKGAHRILCLLMLLLVACGSNGQSAQSGTTGQSATAAPAAPTAATIAATAVPSAMATTTAEPTAATVTPGPGQFVNPVINQDFPDPDLLKVGDTYYAYATNNNGNNIQQAKSTDLVHWEMLGDALPQLPLWARSTSGLTWAPEVTSYGQTYVMYFVSRDDASDKQCIGVATSDKPEGPFKSSNPKPLICDPDQGGDIDASSFADDDGSRYVLWKNDGNCCGLDTYLQIQKVSADGLTLEGTPTKLVKQDQVWEGNLVEAPTLWKHGGKYYLFYSANNYAGSDYTTGYAMADTITGPYRKADQPFLSTSTKNGVVLGPGGQDIITASGDKTWIVYHSWDNSLTYRGMSLDPLDWNGDTPVIKALSELPQAMP